MTVEIKKCIGCSRPAVEGRSRCEQCLESVRLARARYVIRNRSEIRASSRAKRSDLLLKGVCVCGEPLAPGKSQCAACLNRKAFQNSEKRALRQQHGLCKSCGLPTNGTSQCPSCLSQISQRTRAVRAEVIKAYGGKCECCGETEQRFLQIDHSKNDGGSDRKIGLGTGRLYRWLKANHYPTDRFRLLCANCNLGRYLNGGVCPHQK